MEYNVDVTFSGDRFLSSQGKQRKITVLHLSVTGALLENEEYQFILYCIHKNTCK